MAQGEILGLVQVFVICWKMLGKHVINTSGEGFRKDSYRIQPSSVGECVFYFMYQCVFVRKG